MSTRLVAANCGTGFSLSVVLREAHSRLERAAIDDAALEADLLLAHTLGITREQLYARLNASLDGDQLERFDALLARRLAHEPLAYITGRKELYGIDLLCSPAALIPRPETELFGELARHWNG